MIAAVLLAAACAGDCAAEKAYRALESRVLAASEVRLRFTTSARGAVTAAFSGALEVAGPRAHLQAHGTFQGKPAAPVSDTQDPDASNGILVGLLRMGVMHNLARLAAGKGPDFADGKAAQTIGLAGFARARDGALTFRLVHDGKRVAAVKLWLDAEGLPARRNLVVHFPQGDMRVHEEYARFTVR